MCTYSNSDKAVEKMFVAASLLEQYFRKKLKKLILFCSDIPVIGIYPMQ